MELRVDCWTDRGRRGVLGGAELPFQGSDDRPDMTVRFAQRVTDNEDNFLQVPAIYKQVSTSRYQGTAAADLQARE